MTVKDLICQALYLLGKEDIADAITESVNNGTEMSAEVNRHANLFMLIADSVTKELYTGYFPDATTAQLSSTGREYHLSGLHYPCVGIRKVVNVLTGREVPSYAFRDGNLILAERVPAIELIYEYTSYNYVTLGQLIADKKPYLAPDVVVMGIVAEYFCTIGDTVNAALWQERYENKVKLIRDSGAYKPYAEVYTEPAEPAVRRVNLPGRRWV